MKKNSSPLHKEFWVPTGFLFQRQVAKNSLSEPFKDFFTDHFKTVHFCSEYGLIFGFPPLLVPMLKRINLMAHTGTIRQYCGILRYKPNLLTISSLLWDLKIYYHAQKTCYCTIFEPDESSQQCVSLRPTLIQSFHINLNLPGFSNRIFYIFLIYPVTLYVPAIFLPLFLSLYLVKCT